MKEMISKIWQYKTHILFGIAAMLVLMNCWQCQHNKNLDRDNEVLSNNIEALTDTVKLEKTKAGLYLASITAYQGQIKDLMLYSEELKKSLEDYKKSTGKTPEVAIKTDINVDVPQKDTIFYLNNDLSNKTFPFDFSDLWRTLSGNVLTQDTTLLVSILKDLLKVSFTTGLDDGGKVFVKTDNPYVKVQTLQGYVLPKEPKKRWGLGLHIGYGALLHDSKVSLGPQISLGINYNIYSW